MKIKRWTVYDGIAKDYLPKRFIFRSSAERAKDDLLFQYMVNTIPLDDMLTNEEIYSTRVVELT